jgi:DNA primase
MPGMDYHQLRQQITIRQVLSLLGFQPTSRHGPQLRGPCPSPVCRSASNHSFSGHLARQVYHCFACRSHGNALDLWAAVRSLPIYQAALDICHVMSLDPPWLPASQRISTLRDVPSPASSRNR